MNISYKLHSTINFAVALIFLLAFILVRFCTFIMLERTYEDNAAPMRVCSPMPYTSHSRIKASFNGELFTGDFFS